MSAVETLLTSRALDAVYGALERRTRYTCRACGWSGVEPSLSDNTPLEVRDGERPRQSYIHVCPVCGSTKIHKD